MGLAINQSRDNIAESTQRQVDLIGLLHAVASGPGLARSLGACQVDQIELGGLELVGAGLVSFLGLDINHEQTMRARRLIVHICSASGPIAEPNLHVLLHDFGVVHFDLRQIFYEYALFWAFLQLHLGLDVLAQQIMDFLIVDLDERTADEVGLRLIGFRDRDYLGESPRDDALALFRVGNAHHGVGLAAAGLPVGEDGAVVAI